MNAAPIIVLHVTLTTAGFIGLIAANAWLLVLCSAPNPPADAALKTWRRVAQIFGPMLAVGVLCGFAVSILLGIPLTEPWLVATYILSAVALAAQLGIMIPWHLRADKILASGGHIATRPIVVVLWTLSIVYVSLITVMMVIAHREGGF